MILQDHVTGSLCKGLMWRGLPCSLWRSLFRGWAGIVRVHTSDPTQTRKKRGRAQTRDPGSEPKTTCGSCGRLRETSSAGLGGLWTQLPELKLWGPFLGCLYNVRSLYYCRVYIRALMFGNSLVNLGAWRSRTCALELRL